MIKYENMLLVDWENVEEKRKKELNSIEYKGIEAGLRELIEDYEMDCFGEVYTDITDFTLYRNGKVVILEGYKLNNHVIHSVFMYENGILIADVEDLEEYEQEEEGEYCYYRLN